MTIVEAFGEVVQATRTALHASHPAIPALNYQYGHPKAILKVMQAWSNSTQAVQAKMYPLVALFQDFTETQPSRPGQLATVSLRVLIANFTLPEYDTPQRYAKNFTPILQPVCAELIRQLQRSTWFQGLSVPKHDKTDRPFWGKDGLYGSEGNIFSDAMDVIEIRNLELIPRLDPVCTPSGILQLTK